MSVICDLQLRIWASVFFSPSISAARLQTELPKAISPLVPFEFLIVTLAPAKVADHRDREISRSPGRP
jgi:hypothetical protein